MDKNKIIKLEALVNDAFLKESLIKILIPMVSAFVDKHKKDILKKGFSKEQIKSVFDKKQVPSKEILVKYCVTPFYDKDLFQLFRKTMPKHIGLIFNELVWVDKLNAKEIFDLTGEHIYTKSPKKTSYYQKLELKAEYDLFKSNKSSYRSSSSGFILYFPEEFRKYLITLSDIPEAAQIKSLDKIDKTDFVYEGEADILFDLPRLIAYKNKGQIKSATGYKVQASTLNKMNKNLGLTEFYSDETDKALKLLRTRLLASLIIYADMDIAEKSIDNLKDLINETYLTKFKPINGILYYLKGTGNVYGYYSNPKEQTFLTLLNRFSPEQWVSIQNIENHLKYNQIDFDIIDKMRTNNLYVTYKTEYGNERSYVTRVNQNQVISKGTLKGSIFLFAAYGLLDIAYNHPIKKEEENVFPKLYESVQYVRLNKLGAYILGKTNSYELPEQLTNSSIELSTDTLTITIDPKDTIAPISLAPFTVKVSPNRFNTDFSIFLKGVKNKSDLENKIKLFVASLSVEIPENWNDFFEELRAKINPLTLIEDTFVFQIPTNNKELLKLIAQDKKLSNLCDKAEAYQILVSKKNLNKFKSRLEDFGYLL